MLVYQRVFLGGSPCFKIPGVMDFLHFNRTDRMETCFATRFYAWLMNPSLKTLIIPGVGVELQYVRLVKNHHEPAFRKNT